MRSTTLRATTTAAAVVIASLTVLPASPGAAVIATDTVAFNDCEVERNDVTLPGATTWSPTVAIDHPSPVPASSAQTIEITLSDLPANTFPEDYPGTVDLDIAITFEDGRSAGSTFTFFGERPLESFDADAPLVLGEFETDLSFSESGVYDFKPKSVTVSVFGTIDLDTFESRSYEYVCDQTVAPDPISQIRVYDDAAPAAVAVDRLQTRQGAAFLVSGTDFPREATQDPDGDVSVFVGSLLAGTFDVDDIGSFAGVVRTPEFAKPGAVVAVRAAAVGKSAGTSIAVKVKPATVKASPSSVSSGGKLVLKGSQLKPGETAKIVLTKKGGGKGTTKYSVSAKVGAGGTFSQAVKLKKAAKGAWRVSVTGPGSFRKATAGFKVR